ncbi:hypothetical protein BGAL_0072g00130 [Botrytis galanthina]|uniref:Uncharacterized protein n=1 Tax=Botrytis galanthina TaxID=278940 RepID=A0A4S8R442_9HELO|nr:hypothetical protein BGAL_0072g00130 [Botrytis galanthina]
MSKNNLDNLAPGFKPNYSDPRKKKAPQQPLTQRSNFNEGAAQPYIDTEMGDTLGSEPGVLAPQHGGEGVVPTQPAEKKEAVIFGAGMYGTVSADGNNKFQSSKIFGISFSGGKKVDEDTLKLQLGAVNDELKTYKKDSKKRFDTLEREIVDLRADKRQLEDRYMDKSKQYSELLCVGTVADWRDTESENATASDLIIERLRNEKGTLTKYNGRIIREKEDLEKKVVELEEKINCMESEDHIKRHRLRAAKDVLEAAKICHQANMDELRTKNSELCNLLDRREDDCRKSHVQVNELQDTLGRLRQDIADAKAQDLRDYEIEQTTKERDEARKEIADALAQGITKEKVQSLTNERDQVLQELNLTKQQLNLSVQKESDAQVNLASIMAEVEKMRPEFHRVSERSATVDGLNQTIHSLQAELNTAKNDLNNANTERSQAIEARDKAMFAANQAVFQFSSTNSASVIQQLRTSIESLESEKTMHQMKINTLEADITSYANTIQQLRTSIESHESEKTMQQMKINALEADITSSANTIQQLRTSIESHESEKTMQQMKINALEADITKIHKDYEHNMLAVQQNHQHIADQKDAAIEGHQNRLSLVQRQKQEMVKENDEMIQRLKAEVSAGEASVQKLVLETKQTVGASELEKNQVRGELDVAKNSVLEVQSSNKLIRGDLINLQTEIELAKNLIVKTDKKAKLAEKKLAETVELLVKEQTAHKESKKNHSVAINARLGMGKTAMLKDYFAKQASSKATDQDDLFEVEEKSVTPVRTRTIVRDAPLRASSLVPDASEIALMKATARSGLENARADAKAEFTEDVKTELRKELAESIKVELREELVESTKVELREELAGSVKAEIEEALLTSSTILCQDVQTTQEFALAFEGQENSLNLAGIVTSDPATSTFVHGTANRDGSAMDDSLPDENTPIPVMVSKRKLLSRSKVYSWSIFLFILLLTCFLVGCLRGSDTSSTPGVVGLIDAPRPAIIPVATINASHFATRTISRLAVIPATASASVQIPQVTTVTVFSEYVDYLTPILYRIGLIDLYRFVFKVKPVVVTLEALKTSFEYAASFFPDKH